MTTMDKDRLAAFVDGELSPEEAAAVAMHLSDHPDDQAYVDDLFAANAALGRAFGAPMQETVPEAIRSAIMESGATGTVATNVVAFRPRRLIGLGALALAASVAAVAFLVPDQRVPQRGVGLGPLAAADPVADVLQNGRSGVVNALSDGREAMVLVTLQMPDGRYCREFEVIDRPASRVDYAVGCHSDAGWIVEAAVAETTAGSAEGFVPAGDAEADTLTRFLERQGQPVPLDAATEAGLLDRGWAR